MAASPVASDRVGVDLQFDVGGGRSIDASAVCIRLQFKAMMNGGYIVSGRLRDTNFNIVRRLLVETEYLRSARSSTFRCQFRIRWFNSDNATVRQQAYIVAAHVHGGSADAAEFDFIGIDPPSWHLNTGDASGRVYKGRVSDVIRRCIADYAPGIDIEVSETSDSTHNMFWMMGMDPKTFLSSLMDWSASLTNNKTQWLIAMDGLSMKVKEQADIVSRNVAFYVGPHGGQHPPTIRSWEVITDNALSIINTKLITHGISAVSGQYFDRVLDAREQTVVVKDANTSKKYKARVGEDKAFRKAPDGGPPTVGHTAVPAVPEIYSAGELGRPYADYIDGRARGLWLNMSNSVMRTKFRVIGHGIYNSSVGLGVDTITVHWLDVEQRPFFLAGNWIVYGFEHLYVPGDWHTDVYAARLEIDAAATPVPVP